MIEAATAAGKAVFSEKPIGGKPEQTVAAFQAAKKAGVATGVGTTTGVGLSTIGVGVGVATGVETTTGVGLSTALTGTASTENKTDKTINIFFIKITPLI
jgi:hypothetical protein